MTTESFRLGLAQMTSTEDVEANALTVAELYKEAARGAADLVAFPENSLYLRTGSERGLQGLDEGGAEIHALRALVDKGGTALMLTTPLAGTGGKLRNATLLFEAGQAPRVVYVKTHLFDVDVEGAPSVRESDHFANGAGPATVDIKGWRFGLSICYDLRFAELYLNYAQQVDVILIPSAFLVPTGSAHWHVLVRARAIESQCYVAAPAQSGTHGLERKTYGHSLVVDPWGSVMTELQTSPQMAVVELSRALILKVRRQIPMAGHRRL